MTQLVKPMENIASSRTILIPTTKEMSDKKGRGFSDAFVRLKCSYTAARSGFTEPSILSAEEQEKRSRAQFIPIHAAVAQPSSPVEFLQVKGVSGLGQLHNRSA